ncbi:Mitochondrial chaperone Frataxin [Agyrium rufum]|nr:Mitochondrial chaperone Frataxin [Agyrium rufum]
MKCSAESSASAPSASPQPLTVDHYNILTDDFFDSLTTALEDMQQDRREVDVEYSSGVLTLIYPPHGTYVINKQPPSRQIWLSSPVSGPKRFDYVGGTKWIYLKDGTDLEALLLDELGVTLELEGLEG